MKTKNETGSEMTAVMVQTSRTPAQLIESAIDKGGIDLEKLQKLLEIQRDWETNEARKAYHKAMSLFKANPPDIEKDKAVSYLNVKYRHATLSNVTKKINAELSKYGLSASWTVKQNGAVSVTCRITHEQGHSEETTLTAAADTSGSKNAIQAIGSTISYLERYTLLALTGLATHDMDDDTQAISEKISEAEVSMIQDHLLEMGAESVDKFLAYMKLEKLEDMPKSELKKAMTAIEGAKKKKAVAK